MIDPSPKRKPETAPWARQRLGRNASFDLTTVFVELARWVTWAEHEFITYALPACWPLHERYRWVLSLFWYRWLELQEGTARSGDGIWWYQDLLKVAETWRPGTICQEHPEHLESVDDTRKHYLDTAIEQGLDLPDPLAVPRRRDASSHGDVDGSAWDS